MKTLMLILALVLAGCEQHHTNPITPNSTYDPLAGDWGRNGVAVTYTRSFTLAPDKLTLLGRSYDVKEIDNAAEALVTGPDLGEVVVVFECPNRAFISFAHAKDSTVAALSGEYQRTITYDEILP